jgi:hypothetical protein
MTPETRKEPSAPPTSGRAEGSSSSAPRPVSRPWLSKLLAALMILIALLLLVSLAITVWRQLVPRTTTSTTNVCVYVLDGRAATGAVQGPCPPPGPSGETPVSRWS